MNTEILKSGSLMLKDKPDFDLIARESELSHMINILSRKFAHNVLLTGQGGSGCSSLCLGLQKAKSNPDTPFDILNKRIWWLDTDGLFSAPEDTQTLFDEMINKVSNTADKDTILIIEDGRNFIDCANSSGNASFINRIIRHVEQNRFQVIIEVRDTDLEMVVKSHGSIQELFTIMEVSPPSKENLLKIVTGACDNLYKHHGIKIENEAIEQAIYLTTTYPGKERSLMRSQPEASLTLIDRALSTYKNANHVESKEVKKAKARLLLSPDSVQLNQEYQSLKEDWDKKRAIMVSACESQASGEKVLTKLENELKVIAEQKEESNGGFSMSSREEQELYAKINNARAITKESADKFKALSDEINSKLALTGDDVFEEFSNLSGIPFDKLNEDEGEKLITLPDRLKEKIFGQDHVIEQLSNALLTSRTPGLKERGKPDAAFMFCGSSGTGKTALAKALAKILKDDEGAMLRFDMSEYSEKNNVTSLIGAPPGYTGYESGGILTNAVRKTPNSIILFDEIEKADASIFDIFLQVLDDGRLTDTQGRTVSFEHTILIFTTNTGSEHMLNEELEFDEQLENTLEALNKNYRAEFLNRFGGRENIVAFKTLPKEVIKFITRSQLDTLNDNLANSGVDLKLTMADEDITRLCDFQYKPERGARGIDGVFRTNVYPQLAKIIQSKEDVNCIDVKFDDGKFTLATNLNK